MGKKLAAAAICAYLALATQACKTNGSSVEAKDQYIGIPVGYWYQILNFKDGDPFNFVNYHRSNMDRLMGNATGGALPETLKGVWFMDGAPLTDKTIEFTRIYPGKSASNFVLKIGDPEVFSWTDLPASHRANQLFDKYSVEYEVDFLDCPADVKTEREVTWGMKDGSCTKDDQQFATITPYITIAGQRTAISQHLAYFDFYLHPKVAGQDFLIWERRSKLFKIVDEVVAAITHATEKNQWSRYKFTQILDKDANPLQSYPHFIDSLKSFASTHLLTLDHMLWLRCSEGTKGCTKQTVDTNNLPAQLLGPEGPINFGALPYL
ncbi:MAG: hypothetical protein NTZ90_15315 [Proteobacteria bacterium]|nr:hypothetical protein [Pseudomonadota bacterium]